MCQVGNGGRFWAEGTSGTSSESWEHACFLGPLELFRRLGDSAFEGDGRNKTSKRSLVCEGLRTAVVGSGASESF